MEKSLSEVQLQEIAQLVYFDVLDSEKKLTDLDRLYKEQDYSITIGQLIDYYTTLEEGSKELERFKERFGGKVNGVDEATTMQEFLKSLQPYEDWKISNVVSNNKQDETGFVGYTIQPDPINNPGQIIVGFRGSEPIEDIRYLNDWDNNFSTTYLVESVQQGEALRYIQEHIEPLVKSGQIDELYLTGHSLGGNLALFASFILSKELREKLVTATTFNAPGFNAKTLAYYRDAIKEMNRTGKLTEFQNRFDLVPAFLKNPSKGILIDTKFDRRHFFDTLDHHSMFFLKQENGRFVRSESQDREPLIVFVNHLSLRFDSLPAFMKSGFLEVILDFLEGKDIEEINPVQLAIAIIVGLKLPKLILGALALTLHDLAKRKVNNFVQDIKGKLIQKGIEFTIGLAKAHQEYTRIRDELRSKLVQRGVEFVVDIIKAHLAWKRFKDNLRSKVIQKGVEAVFTLAKANQAWNSFKEGLKRKALQKGVKFTISLIKSKQNSGYSKLLGNTVNLVKKLTVRLIRGSAKASKGPRIIANVDRLLALQKSIQRNADTVSQLVRQIQSTASNINSNVGRRYHEWYVQSQIRQIENQLAQVRKVEREAHGKLQSLSEGVRFSVQKYRQVEAQLQFKS